MNESGTELERLITRYLDDESSPAERRSLQRRVARDPHAEALFEDYSTIDREVRNAMRGALGRSLAPARPLAGWRRIGRYAGLGLAACIATLFWLRPAPEINQPESESMQAGVMSPPSWFAPLPVAADSVREDASAFEKPSIGLTGTDREWIVLPGKAEGEFIVIEVNRTRSKYVNIQQDF